jgi:hypothetical protein
MARIDSRLSCRFISLPSYFQDKACSLKISTLHLSLALALALFAQATLAQNLPPARDWTTWGYDQERTGWNRGETSLTIHNVSELRLLWSTQLSTPPNGIVLSTLTAPLVAEGVSTAQGTKNLVFLLGADDTVFALDAEDLRQSRRAHLARYLAVFEHRERYPGDR